MRTSVLSKSSSRRPTGRRSMAASLWVVGAWLAFAAVPMGTLGLTPAQAQQSVPANQDCPAPSDSGTHAATAPAGGGNSGTAPGGQGSTGWTGGTGGSYIGTSPHAATPGTNTPQPDVVTGANPGKAEMPQKPC